MIFSTQIPRIFSQSNYLVVGFYKDEKILKVKNNKIKLQYKLNFLNNKL